MFVVSFLGGESVCGNWAGMAGIVYGISFTELGKASVNGIFYTGGVAETLIGEGWF